MVHDDECKKSKCSSDCVEDRAVKSTSGDSAQCSNSDGSDTLKNTTSSNTKDNTTETNAREENVQNNADSASPIASESSSFVRTDTDMDTDALECSNGKDTNDEVVAQTALYKSLGLSVKCAWLKKSKHKCSTTKRK